MIFFVTGSYGSIKSFWDPKRLSKQSLFLFKPTSVADEGGSEEGGKREEEGGRREEEGGRRDEEEGGGFNEGGEV